jgi:hypothetical protein
MVLVKGIIVEEENDMVLVETEEQDLYRVKKNNLLECKDKNVEFDDKFIELEDWRFRIPIDPNVNDTGETLG